MPTRQERIIAIWLLICCFAIFCMVMLGGATRLTGSGLSMVNWEPIMGIIPPLSQAEWQETFTAYQASPEFIHKNYTMGLEDFKGIFWFEYAHRLLGRGIGLIFFIPMVFFFLKGWVTGRLRIKLVSIFFLGGLQGLLGWFMVMSGLMDNPHVSQYRLTAHLGLAVLILGYILWVAFSLFYPQNDADRVKGSRTVLLMKLLTLLIFITILSGGFVAGLKAGFMYNTFPLMNGELLPGSIIYNDTFWSSAFEDPVTAQFNHRVLALSVFTSVVLFWCCIRRKIALPRGRAGLNLLLFAALLQITLGISTLLLHVPVVLGTAHQGGAIMLFSAALFTLHHLRNRTHFC